MITRIIIFGANGMLGTYMTSYFNKLINYVCIPVTRNEFDIIQHLSSLEEYIQSLQCDETTCIINCAGMIPQRIKGRNEHDYYVVNTVFPLQLAKICKRQHIPLVCPTTDCVFSGEKGNYIETDFHDETNAYGISKSLGESCDATVIRTSIIGEERYNKCSFLEFIKKTDVINGWDNHMWNGITCYQYCKIVEQIISQQLFWKGVRHIYSPHKKSKYEMACIIKDVYQLSCTITRCNADVSVDKTLYSMYKLPCSIPPLEQQIKEQRDFVIS
jgi:dTDP-4-dehydrorhamnose reductase